MLAPKRTFYEWQSSLIEKTPKFIKEGMINIKIIQTNINNTSNNNTVPVLELKIFHLIWVLIKGALFLSRSVVAAHSALKTSGEPISEIQYYKYFNSKICSPNVGKILLLWRWNVLFGLKLTIQFFNPTKMNKLEEKCAIHVYSHMYFKI